MRSPKHYEMGITNSNFSTKRFWSWVIYGLAQALMVLIIAFWCPSNSPANISGRSYNFWDCG